MKTTATIVALLGVTACGSGGGDSALEGIYVITEWTRNDAACTEGASILPQPESAMFVRNESFFGEDYLHAMMCTDVAECEELAADTDTLFLAGYFLDQGNDASGWTGGSFSGTTDDQGNCTGEFEDDLLTGTPGATIRIETRTIPVSGFQEDDDGFCPYEEARAAAQDGTCTGLEVVTATFEADLP